MLSKVRTPSGVSRSSVQHQFSRKRRPAVTAVIERCDQTDGGQNGNMSFSPVECSLSEGLWVEFDVNK